MSVGDETAAEAQWTNPSVLSLMGQRDPFQEIVDRARKLVLKAASEGWSGPPFDPMALATLLGIGISPCADIEDARIVPTGERDLLIEFNPNRPKARIRYSVAHEIAHTLFDDCRQQVRNRNKSKRSESDEWQLEMLCNVAAAEILMPLGSLPDLDNAPLTMERVTELRKRYEVSTEAILLRAIKLSRQAICAFAASRIEDGPSANRYRIDYLVPSRAWTQSIRSGILLPPDTILGGCTAIGFTAEGIESWSGSGPRVHVEAIGVLPFRGRLYPRVLGFVRPLRSKSTEERTTRYLVGDATTPRGSGRKLLAHIVNDKTPNWGAGFAAVIKRKWPIAQEDFQHWAGLNKESFALGKVQFTRLETDLTIGHMISQKGYGPSSKPRVRYDALAECLAQVAEHALEHGATVHMPRIGTGQAGGSWSIVEELIDENLLRRGIDVTVYDLPNVQPKRTPEQGELFARR